MHVNVCPVCEAPANAPCEMCAQSYTMFLNMLIPGPVKPEPEMMDAPESKVNIGSGEDVCLC